MKIKPGIVFKCAKNFSQFLSLVVLFSTFGCATSEEKNVTAGSDKNESGKETISQQEKKAAEQASQSTAGELSFVVSTLSPANVLQGSAGNQVLSSAIIEIEELVRKKPDDVPLVVTFLALLRMSGNGSDIQRNLSRAAGSNGAKNPWFLLEAAYGATIRKEYSLADYLLGKAQRSSAGNPQVKAALAHAWGVRYLVAGKATEGIFEMRKAASASYLPSLLTLGFLALRSGDYIGAERYFRTAASSNEENYNAKMGLGVSLRVRGKGDEAFPLLQQVYKRMPNDRRVAWNYALALSEAPGKKAEAIETLNKYFQLPGSLGEVDGRANTLLQKLQAPEPRAAPPKPAAPPPAAVPAGAAPSAPSAAAPAPQSKDPKVPSSQGNAPAAATKPPETKAKEAKADEAGKPPPPSKGNTPEKKK